MGLDITGGHAPRLQRQDRPVDTAQPERSFRHDRGAWIVFFDESGPSPAPTVRRSRAPIGQLPVLEHRFSWKRASMAAALCYLPSPRDRRRAWVAFRVQYNTNTLIEVLGELRTFLAPQPVTLFWDGFPVHRSEARHQLRSDHLCPTRYRPRPHHRTPTALKQAGLSL
ncbi:transposase [Saccharopolyspora sp. NPDC000995]